MPQYLTIEDSEGCAGQLSTSNRGDTFYDVKLRAESPPFERTLTNVDTGVQRQPQEEAAQAEDFRCDFVHAKRAIAAAIATADQFATELSASSGGVHWSGPSFRMRLRTNHVDRGSIRVETSDDDGWVSKLTIGDGFSRAPNAIPEKPQEFEWIASGPRDSGSLVLQALHVIRKAGPKLLEALDAHIG